MTMNEEQLSILCAVRLNNILGVPVGDDDDPIGDELIDHLLEGRLVYINQNTQTICSCKASHNKQNSSHGKDRKR
tara:strand:+ start:2781 stop:3005 length:225 start_codon:yes stop_codon:yes gene_type:complete